MKRLLILFFALFPSLCIGGGNHSLARIEKIEGEFPNVFITITLLQVHNFAGECDRIEVELNYSYIPWYSRFIDVKTTHPSPQQTKEALKYLYYAQSSGSILYFGVMGYGVMETEQACKFRSKGLNKHIEPDQIYSYYLPV